MITLILIVTFSNCGNVFFVVNVVVFLIGFVAKGLRSDR
jgi:hypothetical protein